jgi:hypothetical protein
MLVASCRLSFALNRAASWHRPPDFPDKQDSCEALCLYVSTMLKSEITIQTWCVLEHQHQHHRQRFSLLICSLYNSGRVGTLFEDRSAVEPVCSHGKRSCRKRLEHVCLGSLRHSLKYGPRYELLVSCACRAVLSVDDADHFEDPLSAPRQRPTHMIVNGNDMSAASRQDNFP